MAELTGLFIRQSEASLADFAPADQAGSTEEQRSIHDALRGRFGARLILR